VHQRLSNEPYLITVGYVSRVRVCTGDHTPPNAVIDIITAVVPTQPSISEHTDV